MATSFVLKKVETFPLPVEIDCALGKGKIVFDCKPYSQDAFRDLLGKGLPNIDVLHALATAIHGLPDENGDELQGEAAFNFVGTPAAEGVDEQSSNKAYLAGIIFNSLLHTYAEHYADARRKNGARLPSR